MEIKGYRVSKYKKSKYAYQFVSRGKREVTKIVELVETDQENVFNLSLGDLINGKISYTNITANKDVDTVMTTIADIVLSFTAVNPERMVYVTGNTDVKTRLYQIYISKKLEKVLEKFHIAGRKIDGTGFEVFEKGKNYNAFLVKRR